MLRNWNGRQWPLLLRNPFVLLIGTKHESSPHVPSCFVVIMQDAYFITLIKELPYHKNQFIQTVCSPGVLVEIGCYWHGPLGVSLLSFYWFWWWLGGYNRALWYHRALMIARRLLCSPPAESKRCIIEYQLFEFDIVHKEHSGQYSWTRLAVQHLHREVPHTDMCKYCQKKIFVFDASTPHQPKNGDELARISQTEVVPWRTNARTLGIGTSELQRILFEDYIFKSDRYIDEAGNRLPLAPSCNKERSPISP